MRFLIIFTALWLTACATAPVEPIAPDNQQPSSFLKAFATLSDVGNSIEQAAAPVYTELARYRFNTAHALRDQRITLETAKQALAESDAIRAELDNAVANRNQAKIRNLRYRLSQAATQQEIQQ